MELQTKIDIESPDTKMDYRSKIMLLGSCFAENVGKKMTYFGFRTDVNPCGILYNPLSVANTLELLIRKQEFTEADLLENNGKWVSLSHHGSFSSDNPKHCLNQINERLLSAGRNMEHTDWIMITFGTSWVYEYKETGKIVANCHKFPASAFTRYRLTVADIVSVYEQLIGRLRMTNPKLKVLFTVSPIRHWKDGAHGNQLSKAILLLAIDELVKAYEYVYYFPSYEVVMDELRDYRFYAEDMLHISDVGVEYIWNKFKASFISENVYPIMKEVEKINKGLSHIPGNKEDIHYKEFLAKLSEDVRRLKQMEPGVCI